MVRFTYEDENVRILVRRGKPDSFGWLRRPELDLPGEVIWERPDGEMYPIPSDIAATYEHSIYDLIEK